MIKHNLMRNGDGTSKEMHEENSKSLNFDVRSYRFGDLDLKIAAGNLPKRDLNILILYLMGHTQNSISEVCSVSRSMISKRMRVIIRELQKHLK